jgi:hypothetical protein
MLLAEKIFEWWIWKDLEGSGCLLFYASYRHLPATFHENREKPIMVAGFWAEFRTRELPNMNQ